MNNQKKHYSSEFKYKLVKEVLMTEKTVTQACKEHSINPSMYYKWQEQFLSSAKKGFEQKSELHQQKLEDRKEQEIVKLKNVIADLTSDLIELKKKNSNWM
jgi:transposase-like protein